MTLSRNGTSRSRSWHVLRTNIGVSKFSENGDFTLQVFSGLGVQPVESNGLHCNSVPIAAVHSFVDGRK